MNYSSGFGIINKTEMNEDCKELEEELERGRKAAEDLIEHFESMGSPQKCSIPVETEEGCYIIEVRKTF